MAGAAEEELRHLFFHLLPQFNTDSSNLQALSRFSPTYCHQNNFTLTSNSAGYENIYKSGNLWEMIKIKREKESLLSKK